MRGRRPMSRYCSQTHPHGLSPRDRASASAASWAIGSSACAPTTSTATALTASITTDPSHGLSRWAATRCRHLRRRLDREQRRCTSTALTSRRRTTSRRSRWTSRRDGARELLRCARRIGDDGVYGFDVDELGCERLVRRTQHRLDHGELLAMLGDRAQQVRPVRLERLDHRHVVVQDPADQRQWESGRLQLLDPQPAGELGVAVVPVSALSVDTRWPEQPHRLVVPERPRRDAAIVAP